MLFRSDGRRSAGARGGTGRGGSRLVAPCRRGPRGARLPATAQLISPMTGFRQLHGSFLRQRLLVPSPAGWRADITSLAGLHHLPQMVAGRGGGAVGRGTRRAHWRGELDDSIVFKTINYVVIQKERGESAQKQGRDGGAASSPWDTASTRWRGRAPGKIGRAHV